MRLTTSFIAIALIVASTDRAAAQSPAKREIADILEQIGAKITDTMDGKNSKIYFIDYATGGRNYHLRVCLSPDNSRIWMGLPLVKLPETLAAGNGDRLYRILERTHDVGPAHFKIMDRMLYLSEGRDNRDVSNQRVRNMIEDLVGMAEKTRKDWDFDWNKSAVAVGREY